MSTRVCVGKDVTEDRALGGAVAFGTGIAEVRRWLLFRASTHKITCIDCCCIVPG